MCARFTYDSELAVGVILSVNGWLSLYNKLETHPGLSRARGRVHLCLLLPNSWDRLQHLRDPWISGRKWIDVC